MSLPKDILLKIAQEAHLQWVKDQKNTRIRLKTLDYGSLMQLQQSRSEVFLKKENGKIFKYRLYHEMTTGLDVYENYDHEFYSQPVLSFINLIEGDFYSRFE